MKKGVLLCFALLVLYSAMVPTPAARLAAASCCQPRCAVNSDCNATCGAGLGQCVSVGPCCRVCLCSPGGT